MKEIDDNNLDIAIALGTAVCNKLGLCGEKCGQAIFEIYQKFEELKSQGHTTITPNVSEVQSEQNVNSVEEDSQTK